MEHIKDLLKQVQVQQGLMPSKSGEAIDFEIALSNDKIIDTPVERLKEVLRLVLMKLGLRATNIPQDEEKFVLIQHIIQHYGGHTPEEILLAFDMAMAGKLDVEVNCYENFSCSYFSSIMNAYREWAKEQHKQIKPIMIEEPKLSEITNLEWYNQTKEMVKQGLDVQFIPLPLYQFAIDAGLMPDLKGETKWGYIHKAVEYRKGYLYERVCKEPTKDNNTVFSEFMRMKTSGEFEGDEKERIIALSKKMILFDHLKQN